MTDTGTSFRDTIISIVSEHADEPAKLDDNLVNDLGLDSLELVELALIIESTFDLPPFDIDPETIQTVRDVVNYVGSQLEIKQAAAQ